MKILIFLFALLLSSCSPSAANEMSAQNAQTSLLTASVPAPSLLEASFMSDHQSFAYTLNYDGNKMELVDEKLPGASPFGASFVARGGAEITSSTFWLSELDMVRELASAELFGHYQVYRSSTSDGLCTLSKAVVEYKEEGLLFQLRSCPGQDAAAGEDAVEALLKGLRIKDL